MRDNHNNKPTLYWFDETTSIWNKILSNGLTFETSHTEPYFHNGWQEKISNSTYKATILFFDVTKKTITFFVNNMGEDKLICFRLVLPDKDKTIIEFKGEISKIEFIFPEKIKPDLKVTLNI